MTMERTNYAPAFFDVHGIARRYDVKPATVWAWMQQGKFPQPLRLTAGCSRWSLDDLKDWEKQKRSECAPRPEWEERERRKCQRSKKVS
jgi:prophage regulatory protein